MRWQIKYYSDEDQNVHVITELETSINKAMREVSHQVYNMRDEAIKRSLIKLGWTPPQEPRKE